MNHTTRRFRLFGMPLGMLLLLPNWVVAVTLTNQVPVSGGGVSRWSQLWQDPSPQGNDLDSDAVSWQDFTLARSTAITHMEWWGTGASELGFKIEYWRQDPGTIAYQPLGVFYYGGGPTVIPEAMFVVTPTDYTVSPGPGGLSHFVLDLPNPVNLAANDASNPRWFVGVIGLTHQAFVPWNWSQGIGPSHRSYQFLRADGHTFRPLPEGRALLLADNRVSGDFNADGSYDCGDVDPLVADIAAGNNTAGFDLTGDGQVNGSDLTAWLAEAGGANLVSHNPYKLGDANLDGVVDGSDFGIWNAHKFTSTPAWCSGDFDANGGVDGSDFGLWNANKFTASDGDAVVPEPAFAWLLVLGALRRMISAFEE